jgi:hypothetical protein
MNALAALQRMLTSSFDDYSHNFDAKYDWPGNGQTDYRTDSHNELTKYLLSLTPAGGDTSRSLARYIFMVQRLASVWPQKAE